MLWSRIAKTKITRKKTRETKREIHIKMLPGAAHACLSVCLPVSLSVCLALKIPALEARRPQNSCPRHTRTHTDTHTHTHSGLFYPTLLICTPLFIRKKDSKATRSSETCCVCVSACLCACSTYVCSEV